MEHDLVKTISVKENPDGSLTIEWDENHPAFADLNGMTEKQQEEYFLDIIKRGLEQLEEKEKDNESSNS